MCLRRAFFHRMDNEEYGCAIPRVIPAKRKESASAIRPGVCGVLRLLPKVHCRKLTVTVQLPANATSISNHFRFIGRFKPEGGTILPSRPDIFGVSFPSYSYAAFFASCISVQARSLLERVADGDWVWVWRVDKNRGGQASWDPTSLSK